MEAAAPRKQKGRSPRYPGISLDVALERVRVLWDRDGQYPTNVQTAMRHWGYAPKSGAGAVVVAALEAFGLVSDSGTGDARTVQLTREGQELLTSDDEARKDVLLRRAALVPPAHKDLWNRYQAQLPSDQSLHLYLTRERLFTPGGATEFIAEYKRTINFARLAERGATVSPDALDEAPTMTPAAESTLPPVVASGMATADTVGFGTAAIEIPIPLSGGLARVSIPLEMTEGDWKRLRTVLDAYRVSPDESGS